MLCGFGMNSLGNNTKYAAGATFQSHSVADGSSSSLKTFYLSSELKKFTINLYHWLLSHQIAVGLGKSGYSASISEKNLK